MSDEPEIGQDRAVVDRVVDGRTAVLLIGPAGDECQLPVERLPEGAVEGTWLVLDGTTDPPTVLGIDEELTRHRYEALSARLEAIRRTRGGGRFGR